MRLLQSLALLACYLFVAPINAAVVVFDDELAWKNALSPGFEFITEDFKSSIEETDDTISMAHFDLVYSPASTSINPASTSINPARTSINPARTSKNKVASEVLLMDFSYDGVAYIEVLFDQWVNGFIAYFTGATNGDQITVEVNSMTLSLADTLGGGPSSIGGTGFYGVLDTDQRFNSIRFSTLQTTEFGEFANLDDFTMAVASSGGVVSIDEPASWPLFLSVIVLLAFWRQGDLVDRRKL
ncbi:hypothetical protein [Motilimonas pumila]|uniref:PEP-CTERM sorting domain-containing protein n=1 Tax=Motilimonas pumila TaxID=2303987 RepID=A0A418YGE8_9GAMM|nr:hypothetical protein [Motilimonas pumila]RJG48687.1 hypothetical protein D1Z90_07450 [Motilimonas pumila]